VTPAWRAAGAALVLLIAAAGCGDDAASLEREGPEVQVGAGQALEGPWTAWLYRTRDKLTCLMVREADGHESGGCDRGNSAGPTVSGNGLRTTTVSGGTTRLDAVSARVTLVGRRQVLLDLVTPDPGITEGVRYYVGVFPGTAVVQDVEILDGSGSVIESRLGLN
jgi:hypothetical protein